MSPAVELHVEAGDNDQPARDLLNDPRLTARQIEDCFHNGAVWLQAGRKPQRIYDPKTRVHSGQTIHLYCNQSTLTPCPYRAELVQDFASFSVWAKPSGMLSQGSKWGDHWTLQRWIKHHVWPQRECLITHRLDRYTGGLMIVAHDQPTNRWFHRAFEQHRINKTYRAIVSGSLPAGEELQINSPLGGKSARTLVRVLASKHGHSLLEITPLSGRKHQIRIHLASIGHPVINDRQYGQPPHAGDLMLQACALQFSHPQTGENLKIKLAANRLLSLAKN